MTTFKHPGIDMVETLRNRGDRDDGQIATRLREEKAALNLSIGKIAVKTPALIDGTDIAKLRNYEVALAYLRVKDPENDQQVDILRCAIKGELPVPAGHPSDSARYTAQKEHASPKLADHHRIRFESAFET